ncbi:MAG: hypothetical protein LBR34_08380 [Prevotella sp.]|nr:hypothetical protein [Prevotella sp.]
MKRLICSLLAICSFVALPLSISASGVSEETLGYQLYTTPLSDGLPSEQSLAEIQQMGAINQGYDHELRSQPGGGPGLGELPVPLLPENANILALAFMGLAVVILKRYRNR